MNQSAPQEPVPSKRLKERYAHRGRRTATMQRRQRRLADELVKGKSPRQAAATIGVSPQRAQDLAATPAVRTMVETRLTRNAERADVTATPVIRELGRIARFDVGSMFDEHGRLRPVALWDESVRRVVSSVEALPETTEPAPRPPEATGVRVDAATR